MGMTEAGTLPSVGFKHGRWIDVRYYTPQASETGARPAPRGRLG
jgi:L-amino acid N-acyltransferase YncA